MTHQALIMWLRYYRMERQQVIARDTEGWESMSRFAVFLADSLGVVWREGLVSQDWQDTIFLSLFLGRETCITVTTTEGYL